VGLGAGVGVAWALWRCRPALSHMTVVHPSPYYLPRPLCPLTGARDQVELVALLHACSCATTRAASMPPGPCITATHPVLTPTLHPCLHPPPPPPPPLPCPLPHAGW
jgi:hypothetical protein